MKKENEHISWSLLAKDVSGELSTKEHELLQKELANNPDIEKQVKKLWGDTHYAQALKSIDTDKAWSKVKLQVHASKKSIVFKKYASIAATVAIILTSITLFNIFIQQRENIVTTAETVEQIHLSDGTSVDLNFGSTLSFPAKFKGKTRVVKLTGEAFFDVQRDETTPFIIETEQLTIKVLGTSFNVKAYKGGAITEVVVSSGKVKVNSKLGEDNVILEAGDAVNYSTLSNTLKTRKITTGNYKAWKTKELEFNNTALSDVIRSIEATYHINIEISANVETKDKVLNATFSQYSLDHVLESVCTSFNLQYKKQGGVYLIENTQ